MTKVACKIVILDTVAKFEPCEFKRLQLACQEKARDYETDFVKALDELFDDCAIAKNVHGLFVLGHKVEA